MNDGNRSVKRSAWPIVAIAALCLGPFVVALLLYAGRDSLGGFGQLPNPDRELFASPPTIPLEPLNLAGGGQSKPDWSRSRWSLVYASLATCTADCAVALERLDQVWLSLGGDRDRVQRILLLPEAPPDDMVPDGFVIGLFDVSGGDSLVDLFGREQLEQGRYFVVDPLGNIILSYPDSADQQRLLDDLERLLSVSRVG
jgi:cytochrome oxidase Cu insertion factor (SCO1/SenC/PrrC family)